MKYLLSMCLAFTMLACQTESEEKIQDSTMALDELFESYKDYQYFTFPQWATYEGVHDYNDRLNPQSLESGEIYLDSIKGYVTALESMNYESMSESDALNYDMFKFSLNQMLDQYSYEPSNYLGFTQQGGFHITFPQLSSIHPLKTDKDIRDLFSRLKAFPKEIDHVIDMLAEGLEKEIILACPVSEQILAQLEGFANSEVENSPFYSLAEKNEILRAQEDELREILQNDVQPAYQKLHTFYKNKYHAVCRTDVGVSNVEGGAAYYEYLVRYYTSSEMTPDEVFEIGQEEVARIKAEMIEVKDELGYSNLNLLDFFEFLRSDDQFYFDDKEDLMQGYREILLEMDEQLPTLFGKLPQTPYDLKEIEPYRAKAAPTAYYYSAPADGSRPGYFYVNTYDLRARPKYTMTALALHEAVPGHHLQIALANEMENVPWFRNKMQVTAFVEGWGLYSEYLGYESGMYDDPLQKMGALSFEMWRACRLVVDVGVHYKNWTRAEALDFLKSNAPLAETDMNSEIDRYIAWPGQALAYKIGELKIKSLRKQAEDELGDSFDKKVFHDIVLANGSIPLGLLEEKVEAWINTQQ